MNKSRFFTFNNFVSVAAIGATLFVAQPAHAQLEQQNITADPGRIERELSERLAVPQVTPNVTVRNMAAISAPDGSENIKFNFGGLQMEGLNTYSLDAILPLYKAMIGTEISLADLYAIANRMTLKYRNDGFILSQVVVPPQTIENGIATLQVVEGYIDNILIQGEGQSESELRMIEKYAGQITQGGALNISDMERQLLLINDLPGVNARSVISPSQTTAGAADLLIILERNPFEAVISANNHGSRFLGPYQFSGVGVLHSALGLNEAITTQVVVAPDAGMELAYGSIAYAQPVGSYGTVLSITGAMTDTDPGYTLRQFDVEGLSKSVSLEATQPFLRSREKNIFGRILFDWRNVDSKNNVELTRRDRIRALRAGLQADFLDRLLGVAVNSIDLQISQGLDVMGASEKGDASMTRAAGDPTFTKGNIQIQRLQRVTNQVNILLAGRGQLSNNPLLSSEEFGLGGMGTVRGYDSSEVVGDDGIAGKVEVQWNPNVDLKPFTNTQLFTFLDSGTVWNQDPTNSADKRQSLTSAGVGVRFDLPMDVDAEFVAAKPLHRDVSALNDRHTNFFFNVNKKF